MSGTWQKSSFHMLHLLAADAVAAAAAGVVAGDQVKCDGADSVAGTSAEGRKIRRSHRSEKLQHAPDMQQKIQNGERTMLQ